MFIEAPDPYTWYTNSVQMDWIEPELPGPVVAFKFVVSGTVALDNLGEQIVRVPGWQWSSPAAAESFPTIEEGGPGGHYLHIPNGVSVSAKAEFPEDAKSLIFWRRVGGDASENYVSVAGASGEDGESFYVAVNDFDSPDSWERRIIDLTAFPGPDTEIDEFEDIWFAAGIPTGQSSAYIDIAFALSSDSDADEDGIYDDWEEHGVISRGYQYVEVEEDVWQWIGIDNFIDLPAMGADPETPDIFVHLEYMLDETHNQRLEDEAIEKIADSFADSPYVSPTESVGINLHVDQGPDSILDFSTDEEWGEELSYAGPIEFYEVLGEIENDDYDWDDFDDRKEERFLTTGRQRIFHYAIAAYKLDEDQEDEDRSGWARINGTDFVISLGAYPNGHGTLAQQAGTFMHELGHNLGLRHGGDDSYPEFKPNYLSVMNYSFQLMGVIRDGQAGHFDFSRVDLNDLYESSLDESIGLGEEASDYGTVYYCGTEDEDIKVFLGDAGSEPIDWNCSLGVDEPGLIISINKNGNLETLEGHNDWNAIVFVGGAVGGPGYGDIWLDKQRRLIEAGEHPEIGFKEAERKGLLDLESAKRRMEEGERKRGQRLKLR